MSKKFHLIAGTHWDREWLNPYEYTQSMLIDMVDSLLDLMESEPRYKYFHFDGQTVMLEDYLKLRPENKERITSLIKQGRILVGPQYTLIDESHVIGESIIRNLLIGNRIASEFGGRMEAGYSPAGFGRISQVPQIFSSFRLNEVIFYRGLRQNRSNMEFVWQGPDGSEILGLRLTGPHGRAWYFGKVAVPVLYPEGVRFESVVKVNNDLVNLHRIENSFISQAGYQKRFAGEKIAKGFEEMENALSEDCLSDVLLAAHAIDYGFAEAETVDIVDKINEMFGQDKIKFSTIPDFVNELRKSIDKSKLVTLTGEFRQSRKESRDYIVASGAISSVIPLKKANRIAELAISRWAEVFETIVSVHAESKTSTILNSAWKELIASQAHDSVTGQGTDEVIENVLNRLKRVKQSADGVLDYALAGIVKSIDIPKTEPNTVYLSVFNPSPFKRSELIKINIDMPFYWADENGESDCPEIWNDDEIDDSRLIDPYKTAIVIKDSEGNNVDFAISEIYPMYAVGISHPGWGGRRLNSHRYEVWLNAKNVPSVGYKTLAVSYDKNVIPEVCSKSKSVEYVLENEFMHVKINPNGTLTINDKITGNVYSNCLMFEDSLQTGSSLLDISSQTKLFDAEDAQISLIETSELATTYSISIKPRISVSANIDRKTRRARVVDLPITSYVTLRKGSQKLDITTKINNQSKDHRVRVLFPTNIKMDYVYADQPFDVVKRPVAIEKNDETCLEPSSGSMPCVSFVDVCNSEAGFALLTLGLISYEVTDDPSKTIALTLLRSYQDIDKKCGVIDRRMKATQLLGEHEFKYAIYLHQGESDRDRVCNESECHMLPMKVVQSAGKRAGSLNRNQSFVEFSGGNAALSCIKISEDGRAIILRLYNPTDTAVASKVKMWRKIKKAEIVNSLEEHISDVEVADNTFDIELGGRKIMTIKVEIN